MTTRGTKTPMRIFVLGDISEVGLAVLNKAVGVEEVRVSLVVLGFSIIVMVEIETCVDPIAVNVVVTNIDESLVTVDPAAVVDDANSLATAFRYDVMTQTM
jgi:hypothetical protein